MIAGMETDVISVRALLDRLEVARAEVESNLARLRATTARLDAKRGQWSAEKARRETLHDNAYARLFARFESQPVIEQAKGVLMAESHCSSDQAFDMLRRASQRQNIRVRDLATQIVARASTGSGRGRGGPPMPARRPPAMKSPTS